MAPKKKIDQKVLDDSLAELEKCARRQGANKGSAVKLRASERDLLKAAEASRDLMQAAVKGDKEDLAKLFSDNQLPRFEAIINTVELSAMHASDQRWGDLKEIIDIIRKVLEEFGTFKELPKMPKNPPMQPSYKGLRNRFSPGERVLLRLDCDEEDVLYSISEELPAGLEFNTRTGQITGKLGSGEYPNKTYTITARNEHGETTADINFCVSPPPPSALSYKNVPEQVFNSETVCWKPQYDGGVPHKWSVEPALPEGLDLDDQGNIVGSAVDKADMQEYTVTATNNGGECSAPVKFCVKIAPPASLDYTTFQKQYAVNQVLHLVPDVVMTNLAKGRRSTKESGRELPPHVVSFSVEPPLPAGLSLCEVTGVISGQPSDPTENSVHTVSASNVAGSVTADLAFTVKDAPPSELIYGDLKDMFCTGEEVSLMPEITGVVDEYSVEPALPEGMGLDPETGVIFGSPVNVQPKGTWTITAKNSQGETQTTFEFEVSRPPPSNFDYPSVTGEYPTHGEMEIEPTFEGEVDAFFVSPDLPKGLRLDAKTGVISGTPTEATDEKTYEIVAKNSTGAVACPITFAVKVMPPSNLSFWVDDVYMVDEAIELKPDVAGAPTNWSVEPPLPEGLVLDPATGMISGKPKAASEEKSYNVSAENEAGGTSAVITFGVKAQPPKGLSYPHSSDNYTVEAPMTIEPELQVGAASAFTIEPALPPGLTFDEATGAISGTPSEPCDSATYTITATNTSGATTAEITFAVKEKPQAQPPASGGTYAAMIESITSLDELPPEPDKELSNLDWMIWMVHRAWLNDPRLVELNFNMMQMPLPLLEPRVSPKLMVALKANTHLKHLLLANSNLQKPQGPELAEALSKNSTLETINIESNSLDSQNITEMAEAVKDNPDSSIKEWKMMNQRHVGKFFGRPTEAAIADLVTSNSNIIKLGFAASDAHWRLVIDKALLKNNDLARKRRKKSVAVKEVEEVKAEARTLSRILLSTPPDEAVWEVFPDDDDKLNIVRGFVSINKKLPTNSQLQQAAKAAGKTLSYSAVAPLIKDFRTKCLNALVDSEILVTDTYGMDVSATMRAWSEKNDDWLLDMWPSEDKRLKFTTSRKQPILDFSDEYASWLKPATD